jgi:small subunit ribosomal protein S4
MRKSKKKYKRPAILWDKARIERDKELKRKFGIVRKKEIWSAETLLRKYRRLARKLVGERNEEEEKILITKLTNLGILKKGAVLDDVLGMTVEDILGRRLQTVLTQKGLANTPMQARQFVVHGHVRIDGRLAKSPNRLILQSEEEKIAVGEKVKGA